MTSFISDLYQFSRPHTIPATLMAILYQFVSIGGFVPGKVGSGAYTTLFVSLLKWELVVLYIVGINQIYDVEIDRINKKYLPLASGGFSMNTASVITYGAMFASILMGLYQQEPLSFTVLLVCLTIGTLYSVPMFRFKQNKALAAISIVLARGLLVNVAEYVIFHRVVHPYDASLDTLTILQQNVGNMFMCVVHATLFTTAVAIAKDLPDMEGDRKHKIQTFALKYGWQRVSSITISLITLAIIVPMGIALNFKASELTWVAQCAYRTLAAAIVTVLICRLITLKSPSSKVLSVFYHGTIWPTFYINFIVLIALQAWITCGRVQLT